MSDAQSTLSAIHQWIERRHQDGKLDSETYVQALTKIYDALYEQKDKAEEERDQAQEALTMLQAQYEADIAELNQRLIDRTSGFLNRLQQYCLKGVRRIQST